MALEWILIRTPNLHPPPWGERELEGGMCPFTFHLSPDLAPVVSLPPSPDDGDGRDAASLLSPSVDLSAYTFSPKGLARGGLLSPSLSLSAGTIKRGGVVLAASGKSSPSTFKAQPLTASASPPRASTPAEVGLPPSPNEIEGDAAPREKASALFSPTPDLSAYAFSPSGVPGGQSFLSPSNVAVDLDSYLFSPNPPKKD